MMTRMDETCLRSCVRGYHVYCPVYDPTLGEVLAYRREPTNLTDCYAVAVVNGTAEESTDLAK